MGIVDVSAVRQREPSPFRMPVGLEIAYFDPENADGEAKAMTGPPTGTSTMSTPTTSTAAWTSSGTPAQRPMARALHDPPHAQEELLTGPGKSG
jgi:hypothetical protein